ncbi:Smr/MutS family protein [Acidiphilium sp.]|uniref:Smr/MutS family protein n=1 Tax=Acidiphilium sp. TaxID=527 RepID=UPI0025884B6E|nr:Smr/MutS family protein [Acidiphilium sp.]
MARRAKPLPAADLEVWTRYLRHVRPLRGVHVPEPPPPDKPGSVRPEPEGVRVVAAPAPPPALPQRRPGVAIGVAPPGLDRATWAKFRAGRIAPERTLDLHGMTAAAAHVAVNALIAGAVSRGMRCVEIVTGHGRRTGGEGVLRREVPIWLNDQPLRPMILAVCHPHAANQGALRVLLRRLRS